MNRKLYFIIITCLCSVLVSACTTPTVSPPTLTTTPTITATYTPSATATQTTTASPTATLTPSQPASPTSTSTPTETPTATYTPSPAATRTPPPTATATQTEPPSLLLTTNELLAQGTHTYLVRMCGGRESTDPITFIFISSDALYRGQLLYFRSAPDAWVYTEPSFQAKRTLIFNAAGFAEHIEISGSACDASYARLN